jgi:hypothetical protein
MALTVQTCSAQATQHYRHTDTAHMGNGTQNSIVPGSAGYCSNSKRQRQSRASGGIEQKQTDREQITQAPLPPPPPPALTCKLLLACLLAQTSDTIRKGEEGVWVRATAARKRNSSTIARIICIVAG